MAELALPVRPSTASPALGEEEARVCRELLAQGSRSFHAASWLLPARARLPAAAVYAFCRVADDAVDEATARSGGPQAALQRLYERLDRIYGPGEPPDRVDRSFQAVARAFDIPRALPAALLEGFAWDAEGRSYPELSPLIAYSVRVASTVGLMMTCLLGIPSRWPREAVLARACDLGVAMQLTNIARDVGEDARRGRVYLPEAWLREEGLSAEALLADPRHSPALGRVVARLLDEADRLYQRADAGIAMLPADGRVAIRAARLIYAEIGVQLRRGGCDGVSRRVVTSAGRKLLLLGRSLSALWPRTPPEELALAPALPEARPLLAALTVTRP